MIQDYPGQAAATTTIQNYLPSTLPFVGNDCLESAHAAGPNFPGIILVDVDNPRLYTRVGLFGIHTVTSGNVLWAASAEGRTTTYDWSDFTVNTVFGDAAPRGFLSSGSENDVLAMFSPVSGSWGLGTGEATDPNCHCAPFTGLTEGLRVGYSTFEARPFRTNVNTTQQPPAWPVDLHLDPNVLLVPIQAIAIVGPSVTPPHATLSDMLALWDRVPTCDINTTTINQLGDNPVNALAQGVPGCIGSAPQPDLDEVGRVFNDVVGEDTGACNNNLDCGIYNNNIVPDDIWAQCGIQFRLVNYHTFSVTTDTHDANYYAQLPFKGTEADQVPFSAMESAVQASDKNYVNDVPAVLLPTTCTFTSSSLVDVADVATRIACVGTGVQSTASTRDILPIVMAHELGHAIAELDDNYGDIPGVCLGQVPSADLMCLGGTDLSTECAVARSRVTSLINLLKSEGRYFAQPTDLINFTTLSIRKQGGLVALRNLIVGQNVVIKNLRGALTSVFNTGGLTLVGPGAKVGNILSAGLVNVQTGALVSGFVETGSTVTQSTGATIAGSVLMNQPVSLPNPLRIPANGGNSTSDIVAALGGTYSLPPGTYRNLVVLAGGVVSLQAGTYYFNTLDLEPWGQLRLDQTNGPIVIFVSSALFWHAAAASVGGTSSDLLLDYLGTLPVQIQATFTGTLVAANASVEVGFVPGGHTGAFFGLDVQVDPFTAIEFAPFSAWDQIAVQ